LVTDSYVAEMFAAAIERKEHYCWLIWLLHV